MADKKPLPPKAVDEPLPMTGGRYIRDPETGALMRAFPAVPEEADK